MPAAKLSIDPANVIGHIERRVFGSFVEHLGRCVYTGIYEPGHPAANEQGFRLDVLELAKELGVTTIRYPGGNFVSGYRWEDGVGPREARPRRVDLAWHAVETNEFGLHEFADWIALLGGEPMMAVNLGTRGLESALDLLEYCHVPGGTALSDARAANGHKDPIRSPMWCLGNEMDGPWQLGHLSPQDYATKAASVAHAMKLLDDSIELVACGSSARSMPTFGTWERTVLEAAYEHVDYLSCHAYYEESEGDLGSFLASAVDMDAFIEEVAAIADEVRDAKGSTKTLSLSFDEWNVWYMKRHLEHEAITGMENWPVAPRLLEDVYSVADAVVVGGLLISLLRHADRVRAACLAQLVNVIAPIMTEPGGPAWKQTTFFPFALTSALGRGTAVRIDIDCPTVATARYGDVPVLDAVASVDGKRAAVFATNRHTAESCELRVDLSALGAAAVVSARVLADEDPYAKNTLAQPERVAMRELDVALVDGVLTASLPAVSWAVIELELA